MKHKKIYKLTLLLGITLGTIWAITLFTFNISAINKSLNEVEGIWGIVIILLIRISLLSGMTFYMFNRWFKQEKQYISDIPHLFGLFLLILTFGKVLDLFWDLTYFRFDNEYVLLLLKIRFFIIILEFIPLMYLSIVMIFYSLSLRDRFVLQLKCIDRHNLQRRPVSPGQRRARLLPYDGHRHPVSHL